MKIRIHFSPVGYKNIGHLKYYWMNEQIYQWISERKLILMINTIWRYHASLSILWNTHTQALKGSHQIDYHCLHENGYCDCSWWNSPLPGEQRWEGLGLLSHHVIGTSGGSEWVGGRTKYPVHRIQVTLSHWNKNTMRSGWECDWHSNFHVLGDKKSQLQTTGQALVNRMNVLGPMTMNKNTYLTLNIHNFNSVWRSILIHRCRIKGPL